MTRAHPTERTRAQGTADRPSDGVRPTDRVHPTDEDDVAREGSELIGGPLGRRAVPGARWWTPVRVIMLVTLGMFALGMVQKLPCFGGSWFSDDPTAQYVHACYSDIPHLFQGRGFADGLIPYLDRLPGDMEFLEYPVLTGALMQVTAWLTPGGASTENQQIYWFVNSGALMVCAALLACCVARTHRRRPWDGLLVALAPALALTATINWDLLAVALTAAGMLMWARGRPALTGVFLGLATAAKLYPALLLGPLLLLCLRSGRWREFGQSLGAAVVAWACVNVPVMAVAPEGWAKFYTFSQERGVDFGSFWLIINQRADSELDHGTVNTLATALMLLGCMAIAWLALAAPRRPRFAQLAFLVVALFILTNKVYSPQYVLWLIPLAALARPKWRDFLIWQGCECLYFLGVWMYLTYTQGGDTHHGLPPEGYQLTILAHLLGTLFLCAMVVRDALRPEHDPVRGDGSDDPGGGVLDEAPDVFTLGHQSRETEGTYPQGTYVRWGTTVN